MRVYGPCESRFTAHETTFQAPERRFCTMPSQMRLCSSLRPIFASASTALTRRPAAARKGSWRKKSSSAGER